MQSTAFRRLVTKAGEKCGLAHKGMSGMGIVLENRRGDVRIFGDANQGIVDNVMALPERLPRMLSALTSG